MKDLAPLDRRVLTMLLDGEDLVLANLRYQLANRTGVDKTFTGAGFYTYFEIPSQIRRVTEKSFAFGDVDAQTQSLEYGAGFLLHVKRGLLDCLEGYSYEELWPDDDNGFSLTYHNGKRDLKKLCSKWLDETGTNKSRYKTGRDKTGNV